MTFRPLHLLIAYDDTHCLCGRVVPRMKTLLEDRAFRISTLELQDTPSELELSDYHGLVLGTPALGLGLRGVGPSPRVRAFVESLGPLEELKVAIFCVFEGRPGYTLRNTRQLVLDHGGQVVATQAYWALRPARDEHILPAECMVRIR